MIAAAARRILLAGLALGVLADTALQNAPGGLGWTLWVSALAATAWVLLRRRQLPVAGEPLAWLLVAVACAVGFSWRDAEELRVANVLGTLVSLAMFAMTASGLPAPAVLAARVRDIIVAGLYTIRDILVGAPMLAIMEAEPQALAASRGSTAWSVVRALVLTVPLALVFIVLFSQADPVFARLFALPALDLERVLTHLFLIGAFAWWSAGYLRGALLGTSSRPAPPDRLPLRLGMVEITTALGVVITLFAVFVALQLRWLFGGAAVVLATTGLTVAEYARAGFFELLAVTVLVLPLILVTRALVDDARVLRRHRLLSLALLVLLGAIVVSALLRMRLYIDNFGLTTDRLNATAIMLWLGGVAAALAFTLLSGRLRPLAATALATGFVTLLVLNVMDPQRVVARVNLGLAARGAEVDYPYLARLNGDAVPTVVEALNSAAPGEGTCTAATRLRERWAETDVAWNLGARRGHAAVAGQLPASEVERLCTGVPQPEPPGSAGAEPVQQDG